MSFLNTKKLRLFTACTAMLCGSALSTVGQTSSDSTYLQDGIRFHQDLKPFTEGFKMRSDTLFFVFDQSIGIYITGNTIEKDNYFKAEDKNKDGVITLNELHHWELKDPKCESIVSIIGRGFDTKSPDDNKVFDTIIGCEKYKTRNVIDLRHENAKDLLNEIVEKAKNRSGFDNRCCPN